MAGREQLDVQVVCTKVLADLGNPAGAYIESVHKEFVMGHRGFHIDYCGWWSWPLALS